MSRLNLARIVLTVFLFAAVASGVGCGPSDPLQKALEDAVIRAAAVRARPIILTAIAAMMGAFFILDDPIFNGLAISLIFGILISTLLTLVVIPVLYYSFRRALRAESAPAPGAGT